MGFKTNNSFLSYLTMGACGVHQTIAQLRSLGFKPIELERNCGSNKLWTTKIKRLRLPDLLCVKTGLRIEVRAKSNLAIKVSDAANNHDRAWNAGLRKNDLIAFIACFPSKNSLPKPADQAMFCKVGDMARSVDKSKLGPAKSASEGAESSRTWPATVPSCDGIILEVTTEKIVAQMYSPHGKPSRKQTYRLDVNLRR